MEDVPVPTVIKPTAAAQAARDAAFRMIPEELRDGLGQIPDVLPVMLRDALEGLAAKIFDAGGTSATMRHTRKPQRI